MLSRTVLVPDLESPTMVTYIAYASLVLVALVVCMVALVATTKDTRGGYGLFGDALLALVVIALGVATIGTSVL